MFYLGRYTKLRNQRASLVAQMIKKLSALQETGFYPWVRKIPWRMKWQPTPVFLPGKSYGQRSLVVYSPWVRRFGHDWVTNFHFHYLVQYVIFCKCRRLRPGVKNRPYVLKSRSLSLDSCSLQSLHGSLHGLASWSSSLFWFQSLPPQDF